MKNVLQTKLCRRLISFAISFSILISMVSGLTIVGNATSADGIITNGSFEQAISDWNYGGTAQYFSGGADNSAGCIKVTPAANEFAAISQAVTMEKNKWYLIKAKVKLTPLTEGVSNSTNARFILMADGTAYTGSNMAYTAVNSDGWTEIYTMYENIGSNNYSTYVFNLRVGQDDTAKVANGVYIDDVSIEPIDYDKIVSAGDFENKYAVYGNSCTSVNDKWSNNTSFRIDPWKTFNYGHITNNATLAQLPTWIAPGGSENNGNNTGHVKVQPVAGGTSYISLTQDVKLEKNKWYMISARVKLLPINDSYTTTNAYFFLNGRVTWDKNIGKTTINSDGWTTIYSCYKYIGTEADSNCELQLRIGQNDTAKVVNGAYVDDVSIVPIDNNKIVTAGDFEDVRYVYGNSSQSANDKWSNDATIRIDPWQRFNYGHITNNATDAQIPVWIQPESSENDGNDTGHIKIIPQTNNMISVSQDVKLEKEKWYLISARVKLIPLGVGSVTTSNARFYLNGTTGTFPGSGVGLTTISSDAWTTVRTYYKYVGTGSNSNCTIQFRVGQNDVANVASGAYIDDISVTAANSGIINGDFENNAQYTADSTGYSFSPWLKTSSGVQYAYYTEANNQYVKVSNNIYQNVAIEQDKEYSASVKVRLDDSTNNFLSVADATINAELHVMPYMTYIDTTDVIKKVKLLSTSENSIKTLKLSDVNWNNVSANYTLASSVVQNKISTLTDFKSLVSTSAEVAVKVKYLDGSGYNATNTGRMIYDLDDFFLELEPPFTIISANVVDRYGNTLPTLAGHEIGYGSINVKNEKKEPVSAIAILCGYDASNKIVDCDITNLEIPHGLNVQSIEAGSISLTGVAKAKLMLWDSLRNMKPMIGANGERLYNLYGNQTYMKAC